MARILAVDNETGILGILGTLLRAEGYDVETMNESDKALDIVNKPDNNYDLMIFDIKMSPVDGMELLKAAKKARPAVPVIMITAYATVETVIESLRQGAFDYVRKPFDADDLLAIAQRALEYGKTMLEDADLKLKGSILVVDDDEKARRLVESIFTGSEYDLSFERRGPDALRQAAKALPDIILLDVAMPDMDGFEVCRHLRLDPMLADVPVLLMADREDAKARLKAFDVGADDVLVKPLSRTELLARIRGILRVNRYRKLLTSRMELQRARVTLRIAQGAQGQGVGPKTAGAAAHVKTASGRDNWRHLFSLLSRGARTQFVVAIGLSSVIPLLALVYVFVSNEHFRQMTPWALWPLVAVVALITGLGYAMLFKYPVNIIRLRKHLEHIVSGQFTDSIKLTKDEDDDLRAIEQSVSHLIRQMEERIYALTHQEETLRSAERHRVMIESMGAACHHLGQPAATMAVMLHLIKKQELTPELRKMVEECSLTLDEITNLLSRLQFIAQYRTESYLAADKSEGYRGDENILKV